MVRAYTHLATHYSAGLALRPGMRKTSITLKAFCDLRDRGAARTMLVIAPLRVCRTVWRQEGAKWSEFRHLKFSLLHGKKKDQELKSGADVYLINPEGVEWLCGQYFGRPLPFDIVTVDELTKFKNHQAERSKALRPRMRGVRWKWGLTGSLMPNYYMDLFGQQLLLDEGAALGRYITHYRDQYFQLDYDGFNYTLLPGAEKRITERIAPTWMQLEASDYLKLPQIVPNPIMLDLAKPERALYDKMKRDMIAELPGGVVTAANQAATYSKLAQMANGAIYHSDRKVEYLHDVKLDALDDLVEELAGEPLLIGYEFNHDLTRLQEWHMKRFGKPLPYLGSGTTATQEAKNIADWNANKLPVMACHPASAGHGLNLQEGNAHNLAWFGITWDYELYDQFIRRLCRSGNEAAQLFEHQLIVRGTIDELKLEALRDKDATQTRFLRALNAEILRSDADTHGSGETEPNDDRRLPVVQRLPRQADAAPAAAAARPTPAGWGEQPQHAAPPAQPAPQAERAAPKGWGAPVVEGQQHAAPAHAEAEQRANIAQQIAPAPASQAASAFSGATQAAHAAAAAFDPNAAPPPSQPAPAATKTTRNRAPKEVAPVVEPANLDYVMIPARATVVAAVLAAADPQSSVDDIVEMSRDIMQFVAEG